MLWGRTSKTNKRPASSQREACFTEKVVGQMAGAKSLKITRLLGGGLFVWFLHHRWKQCYAMELNNQFRESFEDKVVNSHFFDVGFNLRITDSNGFIHHLTLKNEKPRVLVRLGIFHVLFLYHQFTQCLRKIVQIF